MTFSCSEKKLRAAFDAAYREWCAELSADAIDFVPVAPWSSDDLFQTFLSKLSGSKHPPTQQQTNLTTRPPQTASQWISSLGGKVLSAEAEVLPRC